MIHLPGLKAMIIMIMNLKDMAKRLIKNETISRKQGTKY
jgi:hypothetical protein